MLSFVKQFMFGAVAFALGVLAGGYAFSDTQPRSFLSLHDCRGTCLESNELLGLLASVGIQKAPGFVPELVRETDKVVVVEHPDRVTRVHYVIFPKKDIKTVAEIQGGDVAYVEEIFSVIHAIVEEEGLERYRVYTNGPGYQQVNYLHFHLTAN